MLRKLLGTGLLLATLAGCTKLEGRTCESDGDCGVGGLCDTSVGLCYTEPEVDTCAPACEAYKVCTTGGCKARFLRLNIRSPAENTAVSGAAVEMSVQLVADPNYTSTQYPETLEFRATRNDGSGDVGSFGSVTRNGDTYTVNWTPPVAQTQFTLTVSHPVPEAVPSASVNVQVDKIPPTITIYPLARPTREEGGLTQADQRDPELADAYRRDETVEVTISANEAVNNVTLTLRGIASGGGEGAAVAPVQVEQGGECPGSPPFCGIFRVDLSLPEMNAPRGIMKFRVNGTDAAGNSGMADGEVKVTRWKWAFDGQALIKASPAVGEKGVVYFGTSATAGKVFAIEPSGKRKWAVDVENVEGSPAVGSFINGTELVYVASNFTGLPIIGNGTSLRAINAEGTVVSNTTCTFGVSTGSPPVVNSAAAITTTTLSNTPVETALIIVSGSHRSAVGMRPTSVGSATIGCVNADTSQGMPESSSGGGLIATDGGQFAYPTATRRIVKYAFGNSSVVWTATPGGGSGQEVFGLALLGNNLLGSGGNSFENGGVFQVPFDSTGTVTPNPSAGTENGRVYRLAVGADNQAYFGRESADPSTQLTRYNLQTPAVAQTVPDTGAIAAAPVLGSDGKLYTLNRTGELAVWSASDLTSPWKLSLSATNAEASPTLDCARNPDGTPTDPPPDQSLPGVLYVAVGNRLHAFVVDSPRLLKEPNIPNSSTLWPKYQHDARNTGNPATPITNCP